jgi:hypothetical protein
MSIPVAVVLAASLTAGAELPPRRGRDLFGTRGQQNAEAKASSTNLWGEVHLSNGEKLVGWLSLSYGRRLELYDPAAKKWHKLHLSELIRVDASIRSEEFEREWRWQEGGSDVKVYTGRGYPRRWLDHTCRLKNKETFLGHLNGAVLHVTVPAKYVAESAARKNEAKNDGTTKDPKQKDAPKKTGPLKKRFILRQYERGKLGTTLENLVYVKSIVIIGKPPAEGDPPQSR